MTESSPFLSFIDQCVEAQNNSLVSKVKRRRTLLSSPLIRSNPHVIHKIRPRVKFQPADRLSLPRDILKNNKTATKKPIRGSIGVKLDSNRGPSLHFDWTTGLELTLVVVETETRLIFNKPHYRFITTD